MKKNKLMVAVLLAGGLFAFSPTMAQDQTVKLVTSKSVGDEITFVVNRTTTPYSVDWGDGEFVEVPVPESGNLTITGQLKGTTVTIQGGTYWDLLTCSNLGLTSLDVTAAPNLHSLYCQNNSLTTLDLSNSAALTDLNAANNQLTELAITAAAFPDLENVNVAGNQLSGQFAHTGANLQHVNISDNAYERAYFTSNADLDVLKCGGNKITSLSMIRNTAISVLTCENNGMTTLTIPSAGLTNLEQIVCNDNKLKTLNLSLSSNLNGVSCSNNELTSLTLPDTKLYSLDCSNNTLTFNVLPASRNNAPEHLNFAPQNPYDATVGLPVYEGISYVVKAPSYAEATSSAYQVDLSDLTGATIVFTWYSVDGDGNNTKLTAGTSATKPNDYRNSGGKFAFFNTHDKVYAEMTSRIYTGITLTTTEFSVRDENSVGIGSTTADNDAFKLLVGNGTLTMSNVTAVKTTVYTVDGKAVWTGTVDASGVTVNLSKGVYVVNGKKVML